MEPRCDLARLAVGTIPALLIARSGAHASNQPSKPDSRWAGVQVGMNVPYNLGGRNMPVDDILAACVTLGVSALELRAQPVVFSSVPPRSRPAPRPDHPTASSRD